MKRDKLYHAIGWAGALLLILIFCTFSGADIYKWVDDKGVVHFSDRPPAQRDEKLEVEISPSAPPSTYQPPPEEEKIPAIMTPEEKKAAPTPPPPVAQPKVELYVTSWCKYCKLAKSYLIAHNIPFNEYDIEKDSQAAQRRKALDSRPGVPLAVINGRTIIGFSEKSYAWALKQSP